MGKKIESAWVSPANGISMVSVILRCTILLDSGRFSACLKCSTLARLMAHSHLTSPLSEDTSHSAENDKFSKSVFVLDTYYYYFFFAGWSSSCLLLLWSLLTMKVAAVLAGEWKTNRIFQLNHYQLCENGPFGAVVHNKSDADSWLSSMKVWVLLIRQKYQSRK